jgi:hypothetical protein
MDNGHHTFERTMAKLGNGVAAGPVRVWRAGLEPIGRVDRVCGTRRGAITNPPIVDPTCNLVVAYDSANGALAAFDVVTLEERWRRPVATAQHLMLYPDTGELVTNDFCPNEATDSQSWISTPSSYAPGSTSRARPSP